MLTDAEARNMLDSYKLFSLRADLRYEKISFYKKYNAAGEYCEVLARQAEELLATQDNIKAVVDSLAEPYRTVLYLRFIEGHTVEKTAEIMFYSYRWLMRLQATAIREFRKAVNK